MESITESLKVRQRNLGLVGRFWRAMTGVKSCRILTNLPNSSMRSYHLEIYIYKVIETSHYVYVLSTRILDKTGIANAAQICGQKYSC